MEDLPDFHEWDLNFPLNHLDLLSSFKLALVQFHDTATNSEKERAAILFKQRRLEWLEQERDKIKGSSERERTLELKPLVKEEAQNESPPLEEEVQPVEMELSTEGAVEEKVELDVELEILPVEGRRRIEEIIIIDDDTTEDEVEDLVITSTPEAEKKRGKASGKRKEKEKETLLRKKKKRKINASNSDTQSRSNRAQKGLKSTTRPEKQVNPSINRVSKLPSFKRIPSNSSASTTSPAVSPAFPLPSSTEHLRDPPQPSVPALPIFTPNPTASLSRNPSDSHQDSPRRAGRPSPPGPFFTPLPLTADEDPSGSARSELVKQLVTLRFPLLDIRISPHLLLLFLSRNQTKLPPRPVAFKKVNSVNQIQCDIFVASKSEEDAKKTIEMQRSKQLPFFENEDFRLLRPEIYTEELALEQFNGEEILKLEKEIALKANKRWLLVDWKWGELSDEVRREWRISSSLPRSKYIPRMKMDEEVFVSEEYEEEVWIHLDPYSFVDGEEEDKEMSISEIRDKRKKLSRIKRRLYEEECQEWMTVNLGKEETRDLVYPKLPADDACEERYAEMEKREEEEKKKRQIELPGRSVSPQPQVDPTLAHPKCKRFKEAYEIAQTLRGLESEGDGWKSAFLEKHKSTPEDFVRKERRLHNLHLLATYIESTTPHPRRDLELSKQVVTAPLKNIKNPINVANQLEPSTPIRPNLFTRLKSTFLSLSASKEVVRSFL
ncbi:hypothetical protein JCM5350_005299 [Sporobolomyces pararoseus]